eukprot:2947148-Pyramimonas_sp.AAC.1
MAGSCVKCRSSGSTQISTPSPKTDSATAQRMALMVAALVAWQTTTRPSIRYGAERSCGSQQNGARDLFAREKRRARNARLAETSTCGHLKTYFTAKLGGHYV